MESPNGYGAQIRQSLLGKGVSSGDIGYNNATGYVTVGGQNFMKPSKVLNGVSFDTQSNFNKAWDTYQNKSNQASRPTATTGTNTTYTQPTNNNNGAWGNSGSYYGYNNPVDPQVYSLVNNLLSQVNNPQQVDVNAIYNSPQYAAYQAQAQKGAQQGIRAAQESMGAAGFGRSTALGERAQGIQNNANEYLNTQVLPQLIAAEQQQRQQALNNQLAMLGQLTQQQGVYDDRYNTANNYALQKGELLGNFRDPRADELIGMILNEKQNYANSQDATGRQTANQNATNYRNQLAALGYDPALFGADQTLSQAQSNMSKAGQKTLSAQNMEYNQEADKRDFDYMKTQQEWENLFNQAKFDESKAARVWEQAFQEKSFNQSVKDAAASRGLQWASLNQRDKEFIADQAWRQKQFDFEQRKYDDSLKQTPGGKYDAEADLISGIDSLTPLERDNFFKGEKSNIIREFGADYYNKLYKIYFPDDE